MIESTELSAKGVLRKPSRMWASTFCSAEAAYRSKGLICGAIAQGLSELEQASLEPGFTTYRGKGQAGPTEEEQAKRGQRLRAQNMVAYYFRRLFWLAFRADWGVRGKKKPRKEKPKKEDLLPPSTSGWRVYVLELEGGHYYVGKTRDLQRRTLEHFILASAGAGAKWTRAHAPKCVLEVHNVPDACLPAGLFEDLVTRQCMLKFGIGFVRGGSCAGKDIPEHTWSVLETELAHAKDVCFHCGAADHFGCSCPDRPGGTERVGGAICWRRWRWCSWWWQQWCWWR